MTGSLDEQDIPRQQSRFDAGKYEAAALPHMVALDPAKGMEIAKQHQIRDALRGLQTQAPQTPFQSAMGGNGAPTVANEQQIQGRAQQQPQASPRMAAFNEAMRRAQAIEHIDPGMAAKMREQALSLRPKSQGEPFQVMRDGRPLLLQRYDDGTSDEMQYQPKPNVKFQDFGGLVRAFDENTGQFNDRLSGNKTMTHADRIAGGQLDLAGKKFAYEKDKDAIGSIQSVDGLGMFRVPPKGPAVPVTTQGGEQLKPVKDAPAEYKKSKYGLANLEAGIRDYIQELEKFDRWTYLSPADRARINQKYTNVQMGMKDMWVLGALTGPDERKLGEAIINPFTAMGTYQGLFDPNIAKTAAKYVKDGLLEDSKNNLDYAYGLKQPPTTKTDAKPKASAPSAGWNDPHKDKKRMSVDQMRKELEEEMKRGR
jgi:hypothetical protein